MDNKILVDKYIKEGKMLLKNLDKNKFPVKAALWLYDSNNNNWKYLIATPKVDEKGPLQVYKTIRNYLVHQGENHISLNDIRAVSPNDTLISLFKKAIKTDPKSISNIRFTANTIDSHFIDDAYIYRVA